LYVYGESKQKEIIIYDHTSKYYSREGRNILASLIRESLGDHYSGNFANEVINIIRDELVSRNQFFVEDTQTIHLENGHFDKSTLNFIPASINDMTFKRATIGYYPELGFNEEYFNMVKYHCPNYFEQFLAYLGMIFFPNKNPHKYLWIYGDSGTIKSTLSSTPAEIFPGDLRFRSLDIMKACNSDNGFDIGAAAQCILIWCSELTGKSGIILSESFKQIIDTVKNNQSRAAYKETVVGSVNRLVIVSTNRSLRFDNWEPAIEKRLCVIEFVNPVIKNDLEKFLKLFQTKEQKQEVLNLLIYHAQKYLNNEIDFKNNTERQKQLIKDAQQSTLGVTEFIRLYITSKPGVCISSQSLYDFYLSSSGTSKPVSQIFFNKSMREAYYTDRICRISKKYTAGAGDIRIMAWMDCIITNTDAVATYPFGYETDPNENEENSQKDSKLTNF
jgi:phage/plasmid-associated DNA primase